MDTLAPPPPPTGLPRALFRLPVQLYRVHMGWLLGGRFLFLTHTGRISGHEHHVVVEVVAHDRASDSYIVCSGFGPRSDWYQNVLANPEVTIQVGRHKTSAVGTTLSAEEGAEAMERYSRRHRFAARRLVRFMGFAVDGSEADYRAAGRQLPFIRFTSLATLPTTTAKVTARRLED